MFCGCHKLGKATREKRSAGLPCLVVHYSVYLPRKYHMLHTESHRTRYLNVSGVTTLYSTLYNHHLFYLTMKSCIKLYLAHFK